MQRRVTTHNIICAARHLLSCMFPVLVLPSIESALNIRFFFPHVYDVILPGTVSREISLAVSSADCVSRGDGCRFITIAYTSTNSLPAGVFSSSRSTAIFSSLSQIPICACRVQPTINMQIILELPAFYSQPVTYLDCLPYSWPFQSVSMYCSSRKTLISVS